jgi:hypothetical protein
MNPEDLGLVNINETGMNFYVIAQNKVNKIYSLEFLKQYYDISFTYGNITNGFS